MSNELENYRIQLQQVEAALIAEPSNEELLKLKEDLLEVIHLQEEILGETAGNSTSSATSNNVSEKITWKVGDRCLAPTKNGQKHVAVIDGISQDRVAITFTANGVKHMVRLSELSLAPAEEKPKNYIFKTNASSKNSNPKSKEWQLERERRKLRAQKKEQRRKDIETVKETQKNKWQQFNSKATSKNIKGIKRVPVSGSAPDAPRTNAERQATISSRMNLSFGSTSRGNMESLF